MTFFCPEVGDPKPLVNYSERSNLFGSNLKHFVEACDLFVESEILQILKVVR